MPPSIPPASAGRGYVPGRYERLAVADLAIVQGGLATTMELTITHRPFLYFPLAGHFEQLYHVAHRLDAHSAGQRLAHHDINADALADAVLQALGTDTSGYRQHRPGAASRRPVLGYRQ